MLSSTTFKKELSILDEENVNYWVDIFAKQSNFGTSTDKHTGEEILSVKRYSNILKGFCSAYIRTRNEQYLIAATKTKDLILENFLDNKCGGVHYSLRPNRERSCTDKKLSAQAACLGALATYVAAFNNENVLNYAVGIFKTIEKDLKDNRMGGYINTTNRSFEEVLNPEKKLKAHVTLLQAYTDLYEVYPQVNVREAIINLADTIIAKFLVTNVVPKKYNGDWSEACCQNADSSLVYWTCGVLLKAAFGVGSFVVVERVRKAVTPYVQACDQAPELTADQIAAKNGDAAANRISGAVIAWKYLNDSAAVTVIENTWEAYKAQASELTKKCPCPALKLARSVFAEI